MMWLMGFFYGLISFQTPLRVRSIDVAVLLLVFATVRVLYILARIAWFNIARRLEPSRHLTPFSTTRPNGKRILIIGDSTAFGTGASRPEDTISGRLAHDFPGTEIVNVAVNGAVTREVLGQFDSVDGQCFDLVLIFTGGNDIWRFTRIAPLQTSLEELLRRAGVASNYHVVVFFYANFGTSPLFPSFIRSVLTSRARLVRDVFMRSCAEVNIPCIELYTEEDAVRRNPFADNPKRYFSGDYMHPSSEGYGLWYNRMWREMLARGYQFEEKSLSALPTMPDMDFLRR